MFAVDVPGARRLAFSVVAGQAAVTLIAALVSYAIAGWRNGAFAALIGGGINTVASLLMAWLSFGRRSVDARRAVGAFYLGEAVKLVFVVAAFVVAFKALNVAPAFMFGAFVATYFVYWVALANVLPSFGRAASGRK